MAFVYVSNAVSGGITVFNIAGDGELSLQSACQLSGSLAPMAVSLGKKMLYVAQRGDLNAIVSLAIHSLTGELTQLAVTPLSAKMSYLARDHSGAFLLAASYHSHHISVLSLGADGLPYGKECIYETPQHPHSVLMSPDNSHALVACLGADVLLVYDFDANTGLLTPRPSSTWAARAGSGPRHMRFSACGCFVYLLNELDATLDVLAWHAETAQLQHLQTVPTLPPGFDAKPWAADIHLTPDGRCLISSDRSSSTLAVFHVDTDTGLLTLAGHTSTETQPRGFAIHENGQHVLVAGQQSHHVSCYRLDTSSGTLDFQQRVPTGQDPNWIEIVV